MRMPVLAKPLFAVAAVIVVALADRPAAAQMTIGSPDTGFSIGSPGGPPRLELGVGAFDVTPNRRRDSGMQGDFRAEYHFGDIWLPVFSPFLGADVTTTGGSYVFGGFGFDINIGPSFVITPNGAVGFYQRGNGTKLGSWFEFRTGAEFDYKFEDQSRLGVAVHHISNAGLTKLNPGEQSVLLVYQLPLR